MSAPHVRLMGVACARGGRLLFHGVDLTAGPGDGILLHGPNGIGKSSLLRICAGLLPAVAGSVERQGRIALTDERLALDTDLTLQSALKFWAQLDDASPTALAEAMEAMALAPIAKLPVRMFSTGQRKRAALARVIASGARIWLLDEPANGLDDASLGLLGAAVELHLARGGIVITASHQPLPMTMALRIDLAAHADARI
ncbi:heme ABC exporter ATP-binding protein CcmA [Sphingobium sp. AN558]|uniref:heme ABC exporter ATP-binding protein CcmA n=1 Tax=Sphingobium sp. AN558 TaxID=3133442 RepID=UPI0030BC43EE